MGPVMDELAEKKCVPCEAGAVPLKGVSLSKLAEGLDPQWRVVEERYLERIFKFKNFKRALEFTVMAGDLAEREGHHPDIHLSWGKVEIRLFTHKIGGISENDFIIAAKIDRLPV